MRASGILGVLELESESSRACESEGESGTSSARMKSGSEERLRERSGLGVVGGEVEEERFEAETLERRFGGLDLDEVEVMGLIDLEDLEVVVEVGLGRGGLKVVGAMVVVGCICAQWIELMNISRPSLMRSLCRAGGCD